MTVGAGVLLALYSIKLVYDQYHDDDDDEGGGHDEKHNAQDETVNSEDRAPRPTYLPLRDSAANEEAMAARQLQLQHVQEELQTVQEVADISDFGKGDAKSLANFEKELHQGTSTIVTTDDGQVQRQVNIVVMRLFSISSDSKLMLLQIGEAFPDGRKRDKMQLPGCKQGSGKSLESCIDKIAGKIGLYDVVARFDYADPEVVQTELESSSYPGLFTQYNKSFVSGYVDSISTDFKALERIGLIQTFYNCDMRFNTVNEKSKMTYFYEWMPEDRAKAMLELEVDKDKEKAKLRAQKLQLKRQRTLFVIAFIGSVDDLTLFVPMLTGKGFSLAELMSGAFFATMAIVGMCVFLGMCKPVADCLSNIPLAPIVIVFSAILLVKGIFLGE
jgi:hypothetical protein